MGEKIRRNDKRMFGRGIRGAAVPNAAESRLADFIRPNEKQTRRT
jgi:hypothetical protein